MFLWTKSNHLPVVAPGLVALFGERAGPDVEALRAVPVELQLLAPLQLLPVVGEDEERVSGGRVQCDVL